MKHLHQLHQLPPGTAGDEALEAALLRPLTQPLLVVPDDFTARVLAALPAPAAASAPAGQRRWAVALLGALRVQVWAALRVAVLAACGAGGAMEVLGYVGGLWSASSLVLG